MVPKVDTAREQMVRKKLSSSIRGAAKLLRNGREAVVGRGTCRGAYDCLGQIGEKAKPCR